MNYQLAKQLKSNRKILNFAFLILNFLIWRRFQGKGIHLCGAEKVKQYTDL